MHDRLIIFSRYPVPGHTKTRMIPLLGEAGAARLQEIMMGHTVFRARGWAAGAGAQIEVRCTGAGRRAFRRWLGGGMTFRQQCGDNLGARMNAAAADAFAESARRVVLIGCDCPNLTPDHLEQAFAALADHDAVIGPARDGGYYLIGFRGHMPHLFDGIAWGQRDVFARTREAADRHGDPLAVLPVLADVDRPEDLALWDQLRPDCPPGAVSVIIPALNEAACITQAVQSAMPDALEVIVADGGSRDNTAALAAKAGATVCRAPRGRGSQLNAGAAHARGEILLFLHADARLPQAYAAIVRDALSRPDAALGAFPLRIDAAGKLYRLLECGVHWRTTLLSLPYGDQALFLTRDTFLRMGGYMHAPLMEDFDLARRAAARGRVVLAAGPVTVSARRWQTLGVAQTTLRNLALAAGFQCGVPPDRLARRYYPAPRKIPGDNPDPRAPAVHRMKEPVRLHSITRKGPCP